MIDIPDDQSLVCALNSALDASAKSLLIQRRDQLFDDTGGEYDLGELAHFIVVEPNDTVDAIEQAASYPLITDPAFEWVADHGGWYEAVTILSDDGFGIVLLIPDREEVAPELLSVLRDATQEQPSAA